MQIEQALYGEYRGGHSLLASSGDDEVSDGIVQCLDLPDTAPPGVEWSPFLRGFPYRDRYVLSRTFHDTGASRSGMVFSHALIAPLDEIGETPDLGPLLKLLATSDQQRPGAATVQLVRTETRCPHAADLIGTAEALGAKGKLPVVRLGHVGFDDLVVALWVHLLPEMRRGFAFRLSFDPRDLRETPAPTLVCTPQTMAARWSDYPVIRSGASREPVSLTAAVLSGHGKAAPLLGFIREMGVKLATFPDLRLVEQAYLLDIGERTLERRVGALRLIGKLSSDPDAGEGGKDVLVRRLCELLPTARSGDILRLRNLQLSAFPSPSRVWKALETWAAENSYPRDQDGDMLTVLDDATGGTNAVEEWRTAVLEGLAVATRSPKSTFPTAFWRWLPIRPEIVAVVFRHVPAEAGVEERLAAATPRNLDETAAEALVTPALSRRWLRLHGALLSASCSPSDAAHRQVAVDTDPSFVEGLRSALRHAEPAELVKCALELEDSRMPLLAGEAVAKDPELVAAVNLTAIKAQAIWREALAIDCESWRGPADPAATFHSILDRLLDGGEADPLLIELLSETPIADLGAYPRRPEVWSRIGKGVLDNLLAATASGWLRRAKNNGIPFVPEHNLQPAILESGELERTLDALIPNRIGLAIRIVAALDRYDEQRFLRLIEASMARTTSLGLPHAEGIGRLVQERQWEDVVADLVARYKSGRRDLEPTLRACYDMLDVWERIFLPFTRISESEKWEIFEGLAAELYPSGPDNQGLWERADGDDADLSSSGDGRTRWRRAVWNIRNGRGPTPAALLAEMKEDFPRNERILHLAGDRVFGGDAPDGARGKKRNRLRGKGHG
ncbi:MAG: effector-associated domain EAD1-containing protein [Chromatiales bacterium]|nr:effector-associated domain EAD1-containing protein [Chromatiales bacterium]